MRKNLFEEPILLYTCGINFPRLCSNNEASTNDQYTLPVVVVSNFYSTVHMSRFIMPLSYSVHLRVDQIFFL